MGGGSEGVFSLGQRSAKAVKEDFVSQKIDQKVQILRGYQFDM